MDERRDVHIAVELLPGGDKAAAAALAERLGTKPDVSAEAGEKCRAEKAAPGEKRRVAAAMPGDPAREAPREDDAPELLAVRFGPAGAALAARGMELSVDLADELPRLRQANLARELLVKAARIKGAAPGELTAVDATAGLGGDALLLAAAGFTVQLFEANPVIAALLADALRRAEQVPALAGIVSRMRLTASDSVCELVHLGYRPDVVYLDPMFPERRKSAAVKKRFQLLHLLERPCANPEELLRAALAARPRKVVVKRPAKGELLAGVKPSYAVGGKAVRFDVIVPPQG